MPCLHLQIKLIDSETDNEDLNKICLSRIDALYLIEF